MSKPLTEGRRLRCPACGCRFLPSAGSSEDGPEWEPLPTPSVSEPESEEEWMPQTPARRRPRLWIGAMGLLVVAGLLTAVLLCREWTTDAPAAAGRTADSQANRGEHNIISDRERRRGELERLLREANQALAERRYEEAIQGYTAACQLRPESVEAARGLAAAREGQATDARARQADERRQAEFQRLLNEGKKNLTDKQYAQAVRSLEDALQMQPGEAEAVAVLAEARRALETELAEQRKQTEYRKYLAAGQAALVAQRYTDAVREYSAALTLFPGDPEALEGRRLAEQRLAEQQLDAKKREAYMRALNQGGAAFRAGRYDEAVRAFEAAVQLFPNDKEANDALNQARQALAKVQAAFKNLVAQADVALRTQRYTDAHRLLREALQLSPNDAGVVQTLKALERYLSDVQAAQAAYQQYMLLAAAAMQAQQYEEALRQYAQALQWVPGDPRAHQAMREAQQRWEYDQRNRPLFLQALRAGDGALQQARFAEAIQFYQQALQLYPQDPAALNSLRRARYGYWMAQGDAKMTARRYADAAADYARALAEMPGDPLASKRLAEARTAR